MLDTGKQDGSARTASVAAPARTTFADGRMTAKEAWNYCCSLCAALQIEAPTLRTFKWHLRHANHLEGDLVRNPFQPDGDRVYAVALEAVQKFVDELRVRGDELRTIEQPASRPGVVKRSPPSPQSISFSPGTAVKGQPAPKKKKDDDVEYDVRSALQFVHSKVGRGCELNQTTFGFYLAYDVIPSRFEGRQRLVRRDDLEAYLELVPDGVYANSMSYETEKKADDLSMRDAYSYYASVDPAPITLNSFRSLVAASIVKPVRTSDNPKAPVVGFRRQEINAFLALRQRLLEQNSDTTATKSFLTRKANEQDRNEEAAASSSSEVARLMDEALERARPAIEEAQRQQAESKAARRGGRSNKERKTERREAPNIPESRDLTVPPLPAAEKEAAPKTPALKRVPVKQAYEHYRANCTSPFTFSWFREKVYKGDVFDAVEGAGSSPSGRRYLVSIESIDAYLAEHPVGKPLPEYLTVETAYHKLRDELPKEMSLLQFKRAVKDGDVKSSVQDGVVKVAVKAVREYFASTADYPGARKLGITEAHDYYAARVSDPVARNHFARWVYEGVIEGSGKSDGTWMVLVSGLDAFIEKYPTGRLRANRNSAASRKRGTAADVDPAAMSEEQDDDYEQDDEIRVAVSISDYSGPDELKRAIDMLAQQGFKVDVRP